MSRCLKECKHCKRLIDINTTGGQYIADENLLEVYCPICEELFEIEETRMIKCKICGEPLFTDNFQKVEMCISCSFRRDKAIYGGLN